jgi:hypothetical protein
MGASLGASGPRLGRVRGDLEHIFIVLESYRDRSSLDGDERLVAYLDPVVADLWSALHTLQGAIDCVNIFGTKGGQ